MEYSAVIDAISTVGFPIVCFCMCGWYVKYREDKNDAKLDKINDQHDAEVSKLTEVINANTLALQKLADTLGDGKQ